MRASFFVCIAGIIIYLCVLFFYCMKISAKKNAMKKEGKEIYRKKNVYSYTGKSENADFEFYENGTLRFSIKYASDDDFVETVYFPDGKCMEKKFINGEKIN